ncbi:TnsA endonuclease N-terminal domain-containing protein [Thalassospira sp. MIT1004]|uniref:TnsA endonuclease N-terminal domain-containing protein n=3 Tax=Bacteria TaxID=2 RepID=UPI0008DDDBAD|nr:hypothetical protein BC440_19425 [Thalassospira sp. MIT1004]|tara:strand:+ start:284 stop:1126 length:843 start_codon:yes stop_codon:yes gene_type:complete
MATWKSFLNVRFAMANDINDQWTDWFSKYETQHDNLRLAKISSESDALFEVLSAASQTTISQREIPPSRISSTGNIIIDSTGGFVKFESRLERDFITIMALRRGVRVIDAQPIKIGYFDEDFRLRSYTPDFHIVRRVYHNNIPTHLESIFVEVKFTSELNGPKSPDLIGKFKHAQRWAKRRGWRFAVYSEDEIRTPELHRAEQLMPFRRNPENTKLETAIASLLRTGGPKLIQNVQQELGNFPSNLVFSEVLRMLANRQIASDPMSLVTENSLVSMWQDF